MQKKNYSNYNELQISEILLYEKKYRVLVIDLYHKAEFLPEASLSFFFFFLPFVEPESTIWTLF
jgi:hypothetical protein